MAVNKQTKSGHRGALALALAAVVLPGIALAEPGDGDRGNGRGHRGEGREAPGDIGGGSGQRPAQQNWESQGRGGSGWNRPQVAPQAAPVPQAAPAPGANWSEPRQDRGNWRGRERGENRDGWRGQTTQPAPVPQQRWNGGERRDTNRGGEGWNRPAPQQPGWSGNWQGRDRYRDADRNRSDGQNWNRNQGWNGSRYSYNQDYRRWDNRWRDNSRYDWRSYRRGHPERYRLGGYYAPYRGYSYRRLSIGFFLDSLFFSQNYWIDDPWQYRLPDVYGPYRWVRYYDDALLVNVYSGEVVDVIHDFFW